MNLLNRNSVLSIPFFLPLLLQLFTGCSDNSTIEDYQPSNTATLQIGSDGGTITTETGASIAIPADAVESDLDMTIKSCAAHEDLYEFSGIMGDLAGGVILTPEGTIFASPVTVTIPLNNYLTPGETVKLFLNEEVGSSSSPFSESYSGWRQMDIIATVSSDGLHVTAEVNHFSAYVIQMGLGGSSLDVMGGSVETMGDNGLSVDFALYQTYFESNVAGIGDKRVYDLPGGFGYNCYNVVGIQYILDHNLGAIYENPLSASKGILDGEVAFVYHYIGDRILPNSQQFVYELFIKVFIDRTPPDIDLTPVSSNISKNEQITVTGCLTCGSDKMKNQEMYFSVDSLGTVNPTKKATDTNGNADTVFYGGDDTGTATVTGEYSARNMDEMKSSMIQQALSLKIVKQKSGRAVWN